MKTKVKFFDCYDGVCFFNGLVFFAPVALLVRTQAGVSEHNFFLLQALLSGVIFLGEIPTGFITDHIGYRNSLVLSQILLLAARCLLFLAFLQHSLPVFIVEAFVEGIATCFTSGTGSAYLYDCYGEDLYIQKSAHADNFGTAGFIISTIRYVIIYKLYGIEGLLVATVIVDIFALLMTFLLPKESKNVSISLKKKNKYQKNAAIHEICSIFKYRKAFVYVGMLSVFGIVWILITFFYVERLENCGISVEWMSLVVLLYSAIQMLAEPVINKLNQFSKRKLLVVFASISAMLLIIFGVVHTRWLILLLMLILPLFLNLPEYYLTEQENQFVDDIGYAKNRATILSVLNMGVNLIEILALFASALLSDIGIEWCFLFAGSMMIVCSLIIFLENKIDILRGAKK